MWPRPVNRALALELVILTAAAVGWFVTVGEPGTAVQFVLLLSAAIALGVQSSTVQRFGVSGLSTTYLTGTLTSAVIHLVAHRTARGSERHWNIIGALVSARPRRPRDARGGPAGAAGAAAGRPGPRARLRSAGDPPGGPRYRGTRYVRCVTNSFCR